MPSSTPISPPDQPHRGQRARHRLRTHRRFRLSFINENTFNEVWTIGMSQCKVIASIALIFVALGCMAATLIVFTPLRTLLPGYLKQEERQKNTVNVFRVDSLLKAGRETSEYLATLKSILQGDSSIVTHTGQQASAISSHSVSPDSLLPATPTEEQFVRMIDERKRYSIGNHTSAPGVSAIFLFPIRGARMLSDTSSELTVVSPPRNATVTSPGSATIIATSYSPSGLWAVTLQHTNGYVTIIDGLSSCRVKAGDSVSVGESLGNADTSHDVTIQLWSAGTRLNPLRVMPI